MHAVVTGANRGLGLELVRQLAARGDAVWAACRQPDEADALEQLVATSATTIVPLDLREERSITNAAELLRREVESVHVLIHCAGINHNASRPASTNEIGSLSASGLTEMFLTNAVGPLLLTQGLIDLLARTRRAVVANITSDRGATRVPPSAGKYGYRASKAAFNAITRTLAVDLARYQVRVVGIEPGWVRTHMGGPDAPLAADVAAEGILDVIATVGPKESGALFSWSGQRLAW